MSVNYSLGAGKPLISREQNYVLDRKLLTVHSEDRDISKWPNSNEFEIKGSTIYSNTKTN